MIMHKQDWVANSTVRPNAGIDVAKLHLDAFWLDRHLRVDNDAAGWNELIAKLQADHVDLVVVEATGGYERGLLCALQSAGMSAARVNPRQSHDFAKSMGTLAKTDRVDARLLRDFADVLARHKDRAKFITPASEPRREELAALMMRRRQLVDMRVAENNRLELAGARAKRSILSVMRLLNKQIAQIETEVEQHIDDHFDPQRKLLDSVKGIGPVNQLTLLADLSELGQLNRRQISKLVGVAPMADDSGGRQGKRKIHGGRTEVRSTLYMATLSAIQHNEPIRAFYNRLLAQGKLRKVALIACTRKLLTILNAMLRDGKPWDPLKHHAHTPKTA